VIAVLDASVGVSLVRPEESSSVVRRWLAAWLAAGNRLVVPSHFWLEIVNALARRHRWSGAAILEVIRELRELAIESVPPDDADVVLVIDAAERHGLSAYDARYLVLAERLDVGLVTLDRALAVAAGVRWLDPLSSTHRLSEPRHTYGKARPVTWPRYAGASRYLAELRADLERQSARTEARGPAASRP
jgi:predicted nucleic acid-binding protein